MRRLLCIFIGCFCLAFPLLAQSNKLIKELESKRGALQNLFYKKHQNNTKNYTSSFSYIKIIMHNIIV